MKKIPFLFALVFIAGPCYCQTSRQMPNGYQKSDRVKLGLKAGYNWSYATASETGLTLNGKSGYLFGGFLATPVHSGRGFRTEIVYSHQGYSFDNGGQNTDVENDYIYLPQMVTFNVGKAFQFQFGAQAGILVKAAKNVSGKDSSMMDFMNKIDYGFAAGIELNPAAGFIIGGRYNLGLGKMYKRFDQNPSNPPSYFPLPFDPRTTNLKNGIIQFFAGYKF